MAILPVAQSISMADRRDFKEVDEAWLEAVNTRLEPRGAKTQLARALGVPQSQITKLCKGEQTPPGLVIRVSNALGLALPRTWVDDATYRMLAFGEKMSSKIAAEEDPEKRALLREMLNRILDSMLGTGDTMLEHLDALIGSREPANSEKKDLN